MVNVAGLNGMLLEFRVFNWCLFFRRLAFRLLRSFPARHTQHTFLRLRTANDRTFRLCERSNIFGRIAPARTSMEKKQIEGPDPAATTAAPMAPNETTIQSK